MPSIIDLTQLSRTGVVIHKVSEIKSYTKIMFSLYLLGLELLGLVEIKKKKMYLKYLQTPRLLISTIHVKSNMFAKVFH
jgi:hypothetical protein